MSLVEITVTLSSDLAERIERKIKSGAYASASEVINDGLQALEDQEASIERWLRDEVVPGHAEYLADPSTAIAADDLPDRIKSRRRTSGR